MLFARDGLGRRFGALLAASLLLATPAAAQTVTAPLATDAPLRDRAERCGGVVILALSQGPSPVLTTSLRTLAFAAMGQGARSEDAQRAMIAWADAYVAAGDGLATFREDRPACLRLAESLAP
ncbi:hypothetical protein [Jannaschia formosa]|uniref:hypothetical protein n=1 Tax=Jannaschia formosa TaxID=2259592 RepID=UPI000E1B976B|nr:hypothetical protein [Jannaschia formosa]TFL19955.1 hypothetical protein DR046_01000 [Jannaschia formosa]